MNKRHGMRFAITGAVAAIALILTGCSAGAAGPDEDGVTTVRIGITPYLEYQPWIVAHELGIDKEQGINLEFVKFAGPTEAVQSLARGDIDLASTCHSCSYPLYKSVPTLRDWMITNQYAGFIVVGRKGQTKTYDDLVKTESPEQAKKDVLLQMKGKTFAMRTVAYLPLLESALKQVGLTKDDVKIIDFPSDSASALAYAGGTGDYFFGGMPQNSKLVLEDGDKFVAVGGTEVLGDAALWYSTMASTDSWLDKNHDLAQRLLAVWYRTTETMKNDPDSTMPILAENLNEQTASTFSVDQVTYMATVLDHFYTLADSDTQVYDSKSELYWKKSAEFYLEGADLPDGFTIDKYILDESFFRDFQKNTKLVDFVTAG